MQPAAHTLSDVGRLPRHLFEKRDAAEPHELEPSLEELRTARRRSYEKWCTREVPDPPEPSALRVAERYGYTRSPESPYEPCPTPLAVLAGQSSEVLGAHSLAGDWWSKAVRCDRSSPRGAAVPVEEVAIWAEMTAGKCMFDPAYMPASITADALPIFEWITTFFLRWSWLHDRRRELQFAEERGELDFDEAWGVVEAGAELVAEGRRLLRAVSIMVRAARSAGNRELADRLDAFACSLAALLDLADAEREHDDAPPPRALAPPGRRVTVVPIVSHAPPLSRVSAAA